MKIWKLLVVVIVATSTAGCAMKPKRPPPRIALDAPVMAVPLPEPPKPIEIVAVPELLPLPGQLKRLERPGVRTDARNDAADVAGESSTDGAPHAGVSRAIEDARIVPQADQYLNAIQVWPYADGALYQVVTAVGRVTAIRLAPGEQLVSVSAGDTARWLVGDTTSGACEDVCVSVLVKPVRADLATNLVISTDRRTYLLELASTPEAWMASVSWTYPEDALLALQRRSDRARVAAPVASDLSLDTLRFRYAIDGDDPSWKPLRAFDDGEHVYVQFPDGISQGELPPLFVIGPEGDGQLVNYRFRSPYLIVDRLFGAAELRLGGDRQQVVRIERTDGVRRRS